MNIVIILVFIAVILYAFLNQPQFGQLPSGARLEKIKKSPNYSNGKFQNLSRTPDLTEGATYFSILREVLFTKKIRNKPTDIMPSQKTDLLTLAADEAIFVWFGHSSYFMQVDGKTILVDPVFSGAASPLPITTPAFLGTDVYTAADFPEIDYLFISHDHWDHLDYKTLLQLQPKIKTVITGLGTAAHLEYWGYDRQHIMEKDWNEKIDLDEGFTVYTAPARHFSGRGLKRMQSLWMSFVLQTPNKKIYLGGDGGYDSHFKKIGDQFGPFDMAILECGQYDKSWKYIHLMPEEIIAVAEDLKANAVIPVHWSKFSLANHAWDEPIIRLTEAAEKSGLPLITPFIGEKVNLNLSKSNVKWWKSIN